MAKEKENPKIHGGVIKEKHCQSILGTPPAPASNTKSLFTTSHYLYSILCFTKKG